MHILSGRHLQVASDGTLELSADHAEPLIRVGWRKLREDIIDPDPADGQQVTEPDKPAGPKLEHAIGSVEWQKQQEEQRLAGIATEEEKEKGDWPAPRYCWGRHCKRKTF